jgi:hypothetical protein
MLFGRHILLKALLFLVSGVIVYWICRPEMLLFQWLQIDHAAPQNNTGILKFLNNYYGDLVWVIALCLVTYYLAERKLAGRFSVTVLLLLPFISELGQYMVIIPGVFDWYDLLIYSAGACIFLISAPKHFLL